MKKIIIVGIMFMMTPFVSFAQTAATETVAVVPTPTTATLVAQVADAGLAPGDFLYFIDRFSEALNVAFTFNKEKKARKHIEYAKERVAEMSEVLKKPESKLDDVADAKADFDKRIAEAATLVKSEKESGADVADLARELDDELDVSREALKGIFKAHKEKSSRAEEVIQAKLGRLTDSEAPQLKGLLEALSAITKEKQEATKEESDLDTELDDEREIFEEIMGKEMSAEKHFEQAMRLRTNFTGVAGQVPSQASEQLMKQAEEAMMRGDFDAAKMMSKEAERALEAAQEMNDDFRAGVMGAPTMMDINNDDNENDDIDDSDIDNLEQEINRNEIMMQDFDR
ncbi:MAG: DUF5667 domain-containing protein [Minisyncoccia bacterium]